VCSPGANYAAQSRFPAPELHFYSSRGESPYQGFLEGGTTMADMKDKVKSGIDKAADKAKEATDKTANAIKNAGQKVGNKMEEAGQKIKEKSE
jgi:hypothetical protein